MRCFVPKLRAVLFDMYGTLVEIKTNEQRDDIFETISRFLEYRRVFISGKELKELYFVEINQQIARSRERHSEVDVVRALDNVLRERARTTELFFSRRCHRPGRFCCRGVHQPDRYKFFWF